MRIDLLALTRNGHWQLAARVDVELEPEGDSVITRRPGAAFTVVQNEPVMLPLWLDYYSRHFAAEDLYVLDHDSTDGSTDAVRSRCRVIPIHRAASFDHRWLRSTVEAFQSFLLRSYDAVLFAEADEFIVADPRHYSRLADYMSRLDGPAARCAGFNVVQQADEAPLRLDAPILQQRRYWHASRLYSKRLLAKIALRWAEGFHAEFDAPDMPPDPSLLLVHLHRVDYELCLDRHRARAARNWSREDIGRGDGWQNRIHEPEEFEEWFRRGPDLESPRELVPDHLRSAL